MAFRYCGVLAVCILVLSLFPTFPRAQAVTAPKISVSPLQISPNGDGDRESATIAVTLTESAALQIRVLDPAGNVQGYIQYFGAKRAAATYRYAFNGSIVAPDGRRITLGEGAYNIQARTRDDNGAIAAASARIWINNTLKNVSVTSPGPFYNNAYPTLFSPNGDGVKDAMVARFSLLRPADVTMRISTGGSVVRTLTAPYTTSGTKSLAWDGKILQNGVYVWAPAGKYYFRLIARPRDAATAQQLGVAFGDRTGLADKVRPGVTASVSRSTFSPAAGQTTRLDYTLSEPGYRRVSVLDASGSPVSEVDWSATATSGAYTWNGLDYLNEPVPNGT